MKSIIYFVLNVLITSANLSQTQDLKISWWAIDSGFNGSGNNSTQVKSAVGQPFAWSNSNNNSQIKSGFLADRRLKSIVVNRITDEQKSQIANVNVIPNPFSDYTSISFNLMAACRIYLGIYDVFGNEVFRIFDGLLENGNHIFRWDGKYTTGTTATSGLYFYRLIISEYVTSETVTGELMILR